MTMNKKLHVTAEDIQRALNLFQEFHPLNVWTKVKEEDFTARRFEFGYVNDVLCCEMTEEGRKRLCKNKYDCPGIVIKYIYKENLTKVDRLEEVVYNTTISAAGLGPRLLFANNECLVYELLQARHYQYKDDCDEMTVKQMARVMARFHSLRPPMSNKGFDNWSKAFNTLFRDHHHFKKVYTKEYLKVLEEGPAEFKDQYYSILKDVRLDDLVDDTQRLIEANVHSPLVFLHSDFSRHNCLVEEKVENGETKKRIYMIDFDYCMYAPRGHDLAAYLSSYQHKIDLFDDADFPTEDQMKIFLEEYRQESERLQPGYLKDPANSIESLFKEAKFYSLKLHLLLCLFALSAIVPFRNNPKRVKVFLQGFCNRYKGFQKLKKRLISEGLLTE